jgi:hypothetical protein
MECRGVTCAPLDRERDLVGIKVYVFQRQARFFNAAALMNRDLERDLHPIRLSEFTQLPANQIDLFLGKIRLLARPVRSESQSGGDILICPTTAQRLVKNRSQNLQIVKGSVSRSCPHAPICRLLPPFHERYDIFTAHLFGTLDPSVFEEDRNGVPRLEILGQCQRQVRVANAKPLRKPKRSCPVYHRGGKRLPLLSPLQASFVREFPALFSSRSQCRYATPATPFEFLRVHRAT